MKITFKKEMGQLVPYSLEDKAKVEKFKDGAVYVVDIKNSDIRSLQQNKALHKYCELIARALNNQNLSISSVIKVDVDWSMETVKEIIFKPVVKALYNKDSTTKLDKNEFNKIIDNITLIFGNRGIEIPPFPSVD